MILLAFVALVFAPPFVRASLWHPCGTDLLPTLECTNVSVPLDWKATAGNETVSVHVARVPAPAGSSPDALVMLSGGPGYDATSLYPLAALLANRSTPALSLYLVDQRGTGRSTQLACNETDVTRCVARLSSSYLSAFSSYQAARDVLHISSTLVSEGRTSLYGWSYGTFLAHQVLLAERSLGATTTSFAHVILEGLCPPGTCDFATFDEHTSAAALDALAACGVYSTTCQRLLGPVPASLAASLFQSSNQSACGFPDGLWYFRRLLGSILVAGQSSLPLLGPLVLRLSRCSPSDVADLAYAVSGPTLSSASSSSSSFNFFLHANVVANELWHATEPLSSLNASQSTLVASLGLTVNDGAAVLSWPPAQRYTPVFHPSDTIHDGFASSLFIQQGTLDGQTQFGNALRFARAAWPTAHFSAVQFAPHQPSASPASSPCALSNIQAVLSGHLPKTCLHEPVPDFDGALPSTLAAAKRLFGPNATVWGSP
uniref:AB hydrolase-1 domain-containing protein n=1 Tax=Sexangularia sp. CB-2014 TaxID=1486929 RepID=A0A7S1YES1_9EUKA|mmetsp:Transcript_1623/g.5214  ORF Transcript_1623/g.5214 Transcript_1623/m.5214 type:complete len:487 (+) Transcript_1623:137-1597(+)